MLTWCLIELLLLPTNAKSKANLLTKLGLGTEINLLKGVCPKLSA